MMTKAPPGRVAARYSYHDESGKLLYQVERKEPKDFRQRKPDPTAPGGWTYQLNGVRRVPYRLPELLAARADEFVFICEGEKDCDRLAGLGLVATTNPQGAENWHTLEPATVQRAFRDRPVVIIPDNDEKGREHAQQVAAAVADVAMLVQILTLPGLLEKGDVSDWLDAGGQVDELLRLTAQAPTWAPPLDRGPNDERPGKAGGQSHTTDKQKPTSPLPLLYYADVTPVLATADFVEDLLIDGGLSVIYGESNCGKTFFALDLSLRVADGAPWRDRAVERRGVLYLALEGGYGVRNRVAAWRAHYGVEHAAFAVVPVQVNLLDPAADTARVLGSASQAANKLKLPVGLVVVDTLSRAIAGGNENSPEDMGALVRNLDLIRQTVPAHVQVVHHSGKDTAKGARGHSLLRAATDTEIEVTRNFATGISTAKVTKQRDLPREGEFGFRLEPVDLGVNRRGKSVKSCVVVEAEAEQKDTSMPGDWHTALSILTGLLADKGQEGFGTPPGVRSIPVEWWRDRVYDRTKPGAKQDTKKRAFSRAADGLVDSGKITTSEGRVWIL